MRSGRGRRAPSRLASTLFVVGCLGVLGTTFMLGVMAGRFWPRGQSPALTFYQDLTAPLTAPPPARAAKPGRAERTERIEKLAVPEAPLPAPSQGAFTIQVGAYKAREPAEALRARLAAAGHDAYVAEIDASGSVRYRVRVGSFATREAAQLAADKIVAGERKLSAFVTAR